MTGGRGFLPQARGKSVWRPLFTLLAIAFMVFSAAVSASVFAQGEALDLGPPVWNFVAPGAVLVPSQRTASWVAAASGFPAILGEINAGTGRVEDAVRLPGAFAVWSYALAPNDTVYLGTAPYGKVFSYVPGSHNVRQVAQLGTGRTTVWSLAYDPDTQTLYAGTDHGAQLYAISPTTGKVQSLGTVLSGHSSARALAYQDGTLYIGLGSQAGLVRDNLSTGTFQAILPHRFSHQESVNALQFLGGRLFVHLTDAEELVLQPATDKVSAVLENVISHGVSSQPLGHSAVYVANGKVMAYDLVSGNSSVLSANLPLAQQTYLATVGANGLGVARLPEPAFPDWSVVGVGSKGSFWVDNPHLGNFTSGPIALHASVGLIEALSAGPQGTMYGSSYLSGSTFVYSGMGSATETQTLRGPGQAESLLWTGSALLFGTYPSAQIWSYDPTAPWNWGPWATGAENPKLLATLHHAQDRVVALATTPDGTIYAGSVPDAGLLGGALTIVPPVGKPVVLRNLIRHQSVVSLSVAQGLVIGSTSISGGIGADPTASAATLFVFDPTTQKLAASLVPFPHARSIGGLVTGPNGLVYGLTDQTVFVYDPRLNQVVDQNSFDPTAPSPALSWGHDTSLVLSQDGNLYGAVDGSLIEVNPQTLAVTTLLRGGVAQVAESTTGLLYFVGNSGTHLEERISSLPS